MGKRFNEYRIVFMGQTGRGKTTLVNALFGTRFAVDPVAECTGCLFSATFSNPRSDCVYDAITVIDTPGIGASLTKDELYRPYYIHVLELANCVVWVTNMERTDYADQAFFEEFKGEIQQGAKLVVCINQIDKFSPHNIPEQFIGMDVWDEKNNQPSPLLKYYLDDTQDGRKAYFKRKFQKYIQRDYPMIPTNAMRGYGLKSLKEAIDCVKIIDVR